jgi:YfiH family protein
VLENRRRFAEALGAVDARLVAARQTHGTTIVCADAAAFDSETSWLAGNSVASADGLVTGEVGTVLVATAADCVIVAAVDPRRRVAGIAHCGWRGTFAGLAAMLVGELRDRFHVRPEDLVAALSPSIGPCCFEVGDEVIEEGERRVEGFERFVVPGARRRHVNLWGMNRAQLVASGVREDAIEVAGVCTRCRSDEYFSYRAAARRAGIAAFAVGFVDAALRPRGVTPSSPARSKNASWHSK